MYVTAAESRVLSRIFGLLSEDLSEHDVREAVGLHLLELLQADYYASFVWQEGAGRFDKAVFLNVDPKNLAAYDSYFQYHDPITFKLQARREATLVTQVMPQRELMRTEFFNDFLAATGCTGVSTPTAMSATATSVTSGSGAAASARITTLIHWDCCGLSSPPSPRRWCAPMAVPDRLFLLRRLCCDCRCASLRSRA
jgi:hypothetical protein